MASSLRSDAGGSGWLARRWAIAEGARVSGGNATAAAAAAAAAAEGKVAAASRGALPLDCPDCAQRHHGPLRPPGADVWLVGPRAGGALRARWLGAEVTKYLAGTEIVERGRGVVLEADPFQKVYLMNKQLATSADPSDFARIPLLGNSFSVEVDLGSLGAGCGGSVGLFLVSMPAPRGGRWGDFYCDANCVGGHCCTEFDLLQATQHELRMASLACSDYQEPPFASEPRACDRRGGPRLRLGGRRGGGGGGGGGAGGAGDFGPGGGFTIDSRERFEFRVAMPAAGDGGLRAVVTVSQQGRQLRAELPDLEPLRRPLEDGMVLVLDTWPGNGEDGDDAGSDEAKPRRGSSSSGGAGAGTGGGACGAATLRDFALERLPAQGPGATGGGGSGGGPATRGGRPAASACPGQGRCGCDWVKQWGCHDDDGGECFCRCCCETVGRCKWSQFGALARRSPPNRSSLFKPTLLSRGSSGAEQLPPEESLDHEQESGGRGASDEIGAAEEEEEPKKAPVQLRPSPSHRHPLSCQGVGARVWLSQRGLEQLSLMFLPLLAADLVAADIPAVTDTIPGFKFVLNNWNVSDVDLRPFKLAFVAGKGFDVVIPSIKVQVGLDFAFQGSDFWNPIWASGHLEGYFTADTHMHAFMKLNVSKYGYPRFHLDVYTLATRLDKVVVTESWFGEVIEIAGRALKTQLEQIIEEALTDAVKAFIRKDFNDLLEDTLPLLVPLPLPAPHDTTSADFRICGAEIAQHHMVVDLAGTMLDPAQPNLTYPTDPPAEASPVAPPRELERSMLSLDVRTWVVNGGLWFLQRQGLLEHTIYPNDVPKDAPFKLDTHLFRHIFPRFWGFGVLRKSSHPLNMAVSSVKAPSIVLKEEGSIAVDIEVKLKFKIVGVPVVRSLALAVQAPLKAEAAIEINGHKPAKIGCSLKYLSVTPLKVLSSIASVRSNFALNSLIELVSKALLVPMLNKQLSQGFPLRTEEGMSMLNTTLSLKQQGMLVLTDVDVDVSQFMLGRYGEKATGRAMGIAREAVQRR